MAGLFFKKSKGPSLPPAGGTQQAQTQQMTQQQVQQQVQLASFFVFSYNHLVKNRAQYNFNVQYTRLRL